MKSDSMRIVNNLKSGMMKISYSPDICAPFGGNRLRKSIIYHAKQPVSICSKDHLLDVFGL